MLMLGSAHPALASFHLFPVWCLPQSSGRFRGPGIRRIADRQHAAYLVCQECGRLGRPAGYHPRPVRVRRHRVGDHIDCTTQRRAGTPGVVRRGNLPVLRYRVWILPASPKEKRLTVSPRSALSGFKVLEKPVPA